MKALSGQTQITVKVSPGAAKNELTGFADGILRIKIAAPPVRDKANKELVDFLSNCLGISKARVTILKGHTSRHKIIAISGLGREEIIKRLFPDIQSSLPGLSPGA